MDTLFVRRKCPRVEEDIYKKAYANRIGESPGDSKIISEYAFWISLKDFLLILKCDAN